MHFRSVKKKKNKITTSLTYLKPEAEVVPLASVDSAVKGRSLSGIDLHTLYSQEMRSIHCGGKKANVCTICNMQNIFCGDMKRSEFDNSDLILTTGVESSHSIATS